MASALVLMHRSEFDLEFSVVSVSASGAVPGFTARVYSIHYAHLTAVVTLCGGAAWCVRVCVCLRR